MDYISKEDKEAIDYAKNCLRKITIGLDVDFDVNILDKLLNNITKQQKENEYIQKELDKQQTTINNYAKENEEKDKIIDLMAKYINYLSDELVQATGKNELEFCNGNKCCKDSNYSCKDCIKQYFERKSEE